MRQSPPISVGLKRRCAVPVVTLRKAVTERWAEAQAESTQCRHEHFTVRALLCLGSAAYKPTVAMPASPSSNSDPTNLC